MFSLSAFSCCGLSLPCQGLENIAENIKAVSYIPNIRTGRRLFSFYTYAIFSARKGIGRKMIYFPLSLTGAI